MLTLIFPGSGRRQEIARGAYESVQLSPKGKYAIWWDYNERAWFVYDVAAEQVRNLTGGIDTVFWDEKDDHPMMPESYGLAFWATEDAEVVLYEPVRPLAGPAFRRVRLPHHPRPGAETDLPLLENQGRGGRPRRQTPGAGVPERFR